MNRRSFFAATAGIGATFALGAAPADNNSISTRKKRIKLGIASYSYWHFRDPRGVDRNGDRQGRTIGG